jgi:magnesium chelatase subunit H
MKVAVLYVGSSLLKSLRRAEHDINKRYGLGLTIAAHNCTLPLSDSAWAGVERDLEQAGIVFVIHVTDTENGLRTCGVLDRLRSRHRAVIVINCMRDLMQRTRMGDHALFKIFDSKEQPFLHKLGSWMAGYARAHRANGGQRKPEQYLKLVEQAFAILRFVPAIGALGDIKHYLTLYCYFLQPTPANIRSMILYAVKHYAPGRGKRIRIDPPEARPVAGIYHPDAESLFESFDAYRKWYKRKPLDSNETIGLLLLRPQIVSGARRHYDALIRALESEGLAVIPVLSTFMDNREACQAFFVNAEGQSPRVSQILSLTGFSFVGGPAMNDSKAAVAYLKALNCPLRSAVSLETQSVEDWLGSAIGLNAVQSTMQVAIPEIDGATEPFLYGGLPSGKDEPEPIEERCVRIARRLARWNRLRLRPKADVRLALIIYCFPPNKGNLGTAADLDVFPSLWDVLRRLENEGYTVAAPRSPDALREMLLDGHHLARVAYRLPADEYWRLCPYVKDIEAEWGPAPGRINAEGRDILIHGIELGNVFVAVQPTFGYEGDPMRLLMAKGGTPHHGFMGLYVYLDKIFHADALVHVGTHGALEFMPGKQVGLSSRCWPDRLIGEFPNIYIYSVNNPSEGSIAKRRSYAELISYLTPPIENAGLYKELASLKELLAAYRQSRDQAQKSQLFAAIEETAAALNMKTD